MMLTAVKLMKIAFRDVRKVIYLYFPQYNDLPSPAFCLKGGLMVK
jgi:hypothetical protein